MFPLISEQDIQEYTHLPPHAALELGLVYRKKDDYEEARFWLNKAIYDYSNYMNATTVHIRAHTALTIMRNAEEVESGANIEDVYAGFEEKLREMKKQQIKNGQTGPMDESAVPKNLLDQALEVEDLS